MKEKTVTQIDYEYMPRYRELVNLMLSEVVKGSPLLKHSDKTQVSLAISRIAYGAIICETDPMGQKHE